MLLQMGNSWFAVRFESLPIHFHLLLYREELRMWRVKEQKHDNCIATKDSDYDIISEFADEDKARRYYCFVCLHNFRVILEETVV